MNNLELYKVFYCVAKCGSLTKAAQELYISQPAVSQSVKQLEGLLGVTLFNRTHRGMELTSAGGKLIYKKVEDALYLIEEAENSISELKSTPTGTLRIGASDSIFSYVLADKIAEFSEKYPSVKLELISATSPDTLNRLKEDKCDIAFVNLPVDDTGVKLLETVTHLNDIFVAGKKYAGLEGKTLPLGGLRDYPLMMIEENTVARRTADVFAKSLGIDLRPDIEVANWDFMVKLAVKGMGIGCVPREYCLRQLSSGELFEVKTFPSLPVRGVGIALPKNAPASFAVKQFINLFNGKA